MKGGTQAGHIFYVKYHVPIADEQQALEQACVDTVGLEAEDVAGRSRQEGAARPGEALRHVRDRGRRAGRLQQRRLGGVGTDLRFDLVLADLEEVAILDPALVGHPVAGTVEEGSIGADVLEKIGVVAEADLGVPRRDEVLVVRQAPVAGLGTADHRVPAGQYVAKNEADFSGLCPRRS